MLKLYLLLVLGFFTYSYGFTDFNLTLSSNPQILEFIAWARTLSVFDRELGVKIYLGLVSAAFFIYVSRALILPTLKTFPWKIIIFVAVISSLAYPFLSSDIFKYLFTGKIVAFYRSSPYAFAPDHFADDLWLRFMRWVHTPTPYGPVMTALGTLYYLAGMGRFTPALYLYKLDQVFWYLLSVWLIGKLSNQHSSVKNMLFFALNPLVIVEWLINSHNDAAMITLLLLALYLLRNKRKVLSLISLFLSIGIKYATVLALPLFFLKRKISPSISHIYLLLSFFLAPLLYNYSTQYQPWYITWILPFATLSGSAEVKWISAAYSLGGLLRYLPFISTGLWQASPAQFAALTFAPPIFVLLLGSLWHRTRST